MIDHRASPGLPAELSIRMGLDPRFTGEGKLLELATLTCAHCRSPKIKNPLRTRERGRCVKCDAYVCDRCAGIMAQPDYNHMPFEKIVDVTVDFAAKQQSMGSPPVLLGLKPVAA